MKAKQQICAWCSTIISGDEAGRIATPKENAKASHGICVVCYEAQVRALELIVKDQREG